MLTRKRKCHAWEENCAVCFKLSSAQLSEAMGKQNLLVLVVLLLLEASRGFPSEATTDSPFSEDGNANDTLVQRCYEEHYPVFFKRCSLGTQAFREAMVECARDLHLNLPCHMQKMASDKLLDCVDDEEAFQKFWQDANDKCYDACIARRLLLITEDEQPDVEQILEFVASLPILEGRGLDDKEKTMVRECLTNSSYSPGYGPEVEQEGRPLCNFISKVANCSIIPMEQKYTLCIEKVCQEMSEAAA